MKKERTIDMKNNKNNTTMSWNLEFPYSCIRFEFAESVDINKAFDAMKSSVNGIGAWAEVLVSNEPNTFIFHLGVLSDDYYHGIPVICKAIAEAIPAVCFNGYAVFDHYDIDEFEFSYDGSILQMKETFYGEDCGYFCPECGGLAAYADEEIDGDEIACENCEELIKVSDLKYVAPLVSEEVLRIR